MTGRSRSPRVAGPIAHIPLTQGYEAVVDAADVSLVGSFNWYAEIEKRPDGSIKAVYAVRKRRDANGVQKGERLHRVILGAAPGLEVDHRDGNGLNNKRSNLRIATTAQNQRNQRISSVNTSGYKGVTWHSQRGKWQAQIKINGKVKYLGCFTSALDASAAYQSAAVDAFGEWANIGVKK